MSKVKSVLLELLTKVDDLKKEIDKFHPLPVDVEERIMQKFRLDWNYNSNAIEGNTLNYGETFAFLMHGITAQGKPLKDYLDIKGHNQAINYLLNFVRNREELTEAVIRELHKTILVELYEIDAVTTDGKPTKRTVTPGAYKTQPNHVKTATGEMHYFATPEETPAKMNDLMTWYRKTREDKEVHPVVLAAFFHHKFVSIHPFDDGNGRMARLLMNLLLMQNNYPPVVIKTRDKNNYYLALSQADAGDTSPFAEYVANALIHSEEIYLKGARGESIDEPDDLDKEILLLKKELEGNNDWIEKTGTIENKQEIVKNSYRKLLFRCKDTVEKFYTLFSDYSFSYWLYKKETGGIGYKQGRDFNVSQLSKALDAAQDTRYIVSAFELMKFKSSSNKFDLTVSIEVYFDDFEYALSTSLGEENDDEVNTFSDIVINSTWFKTFPYTKNIDEFQIQKVTQQIGKNIVELLKNRSLRNNNE